MSWLAIFWWWGGDFKSGLVCQPLQKLSAQISLLCSKMEEDKYSTNGKPFKHVTQKISPLSLLAPCSLATFGNNTKTFFFFHILKNIYICRHPSSFPCTTEFSTFPLNFFSCILMLSVNSHSVVIYAQCMQLGQLGTKIMLHINSANWSKNEHWTYFDGLPN